MVDLRTTYLGLELRSPIVASSGPFTKSPDDLRRLADAGVGAVVLPSLFEEQIEHETHEVDRLMSVHHDSFGEATTMFATIDHSDPVDRYLDRIEEAKKAVDVPVIASMNGSSLGMWARTAPLLVDAGADAIELNLYTVAADPVRSAASIEEEQLELVSTVSNAISAPLAVKISPYYSSLSNFLLQLEQSGASGVVMFNRFYAPDLDMDTLEVTPQIALSSTPEIRLPLRWIGIARDFLTMSIGGSTGVHSGHGAAKLILAGADVAMTTSALLFNGPGYVHVIERELTDWMSEHDYHSVSEMRGAVRREAAADPSAFERANYIGTLRSYTSRFLGTKPIGLRRS